MQTFKDFVEFHQSNYSHLTLSIEQLHNLLSGKFESNKAFGRYSISNGSYTIETRTNTDIVIPYNKISISNTGKTVYFHPNWNVLDDRFNLCDPSQSASQMHVDILKIFLLESIASHLEKVYKPRRKRLPRTALEVPDGLRHIIDYDFIFTDQIDPLLIQKMMENYSEIRSFLMKLDMI